MQDQNQSQKSQCQKCDADSNLQDHPDCSSSCSPTRLINPIQLCILVTKQAFEQLSLHPKGKNEFQEEPGQSIINECISQSVSQKIGHKAENILTENQVRTSDLGNEQYSQENMKLLYYLVIELLSRPYPSQVQVCFIKSQIESYNRQTNPKLQNQYLRDLKDYYVQRSYGYPISEPQIQAYLKDYKATLMINNFMIQFLDIFLEQELLEDQLSILKQFVIMEYFNKPQEQVNSEFYIRTQLVKIQQICITPKYQSCKVEYTNYQLQIIDNILQLFRVLNNELSIEQQDQIIDKHKKIILRKDYSVTEYLMTLLKLIKKAIIKQGFFINLQQFALKYPNVFRDHFKKFLKRKSVADRKLLETYYIWIFQKKRFSDKFGECIQSIIGSRAHYIKLLEQDIKLVEQIIHSEGAWQAIFMINSYAQQPQNQQQEYSVLIDFLRSRQVISFDIDGVSGITLFDGTIGLNRESVYPYGLNDRKRALTIVTILHETFGHKKRIEYVNQNNVLKSTPKTLREAGEYVEQMIFGDDLMEVSYEQADYILNSENWTTNKSSKTIISEFSSLQVPAESQKLKESDRQTLKQSNREQQVIVGCCALQKDKIIKKQ